MRLRSERSPANPAFTIGQADAVGLLWAHEPAVRGLNNPYPLPVNLRLADEDLFPVWTTLVRLATGGGRQRSRADDADNATLQPTVRKSHTARPSTQMIPRS